jgi:hypothetical protein
MRKNLGITFYLPGDYEVKVVKEPTKIVSIIKKDAVEPVAEKEPVKEISIVKKEKILVVIKKSLPNITIQ